MLPEKHSFPRLLRICLFTLVALGASGAETASAAGEIKPVIQTGHSSCVNTIEFSPDGKYLLTGAYDATVKLWSVEGELIRTFHMFMDTCRSGGAVKSLGLIAMARGVDEQRLISRLAKDRGVSIISASSAAQDAYELKALDNGLLTHSLLQALGKRGEEISTDSLVQVQKLMSVVNSLTREAAYEHLKVEQSPIIYFFGDDFTIGRL